MSKIRIHVGGLPLPCTSAEASDLLSRAALREVKASVAVDGLTGLQRPYAFADVFGRVGGAAGDEADAESVVKRIKKSLNGCKWKGSKLVVDVARPDPAIKQQKRVEGVVVSDDGSDSGSPVSKCVPCGQGKLAKLGLPSRILRVQRKPGDRIIFVDPEPSGVFSSAAAQGTNEPRKWVKVHRATRCTTFQDIVSSGDPFKVPGEASVIGSHVVGGKDGSTLSDMEESRQDNFLPHEKALEANDEDIGTILQQEQEQNFALLHRMCETEFAKQSSNGPSKTEERPTSILNSFVPTERFVPMDTSLSPEEEERALPHASSSYPISTFESVHEQKLDRYCIQQESALTNIFHVQAGASSRSREEEQEAKGFKLSSMFGMDDEEESFHPSSNPDQAAMKNDPDSTGTTGDPSSINGTVLWTNIEQLMSEASSFVRTDPEDVIEEKWRVMRSDILSNIKWKQRLAMDRKERENRSLNRGEKRNLDL